MARTPPPTTPPRVCFSCFGWQPMGALHMFSRNRLRCSALSPDLNASPSASLCPSPSPCPSPPRLSPSPLPLSVSVSRSTCRRPTNSAQRVYGLVVGATHTHARACACTCVYVCVWVYLVFVIGCRARAEFAYGCARAGARLESSRLALGRASAASCASSLHSPVQQDAGEPECR